MLDPCAMKVALSSMSDNSTPETFLPYCLNHKYSN